MEVISDIFIQPSTKILKVNLSHFLSIRNSEIHYKVAY